MNRKDLRALTLVGPPREILEIDPPSCTTPQQPTTNLYFSNTMLMVERVL